MSECTFCHAPLAEGNHGPCLLAMAEIYRAELRRLLYENDRLRSQLRDAGILRKDQL
jgi:hypothetical protein